MSPSNNLTSSSPVVDGEDGSILGATATPVKKPATEKRKPEKRPDGKERRTRGKRSHHTAGLSKPVDDKVAEEDLLGRGRLVSILKGIIDRDIKKHLTIALFGQWGSGKSSVIGLLSKKYKEDDHCSVILFNAWQNEHSQNMTASIAERMVDELYERRGFLSQLWLSFKRQLLQDKMGLAFYLILLGSLAWALLFGLKLGSLEIKALPAPRDGGRSLGDMAAYALAALVAAYPIARKFLKNPFVGKLRELARRPNFSEHIGLNHSIRSQLDNLVRARDFDTRHFILSRLTGKDKKPHKFLLAIDDLDRCSDDKIIQVLEAVQLVVDLDNVLVILAVDDEVLMRAVASRYQKQRGALSDADALALARKYLGKILQVTISLDEPSARRRQHFISKRLFSDVTADISDILEVNTGSAEAPGSQRENPAAFLLRPQVSMEADFPEDPGEPTGYLRNTREEMEFFSRCVGAFNIHNARTMIRIHNAVTLIKGLRPEVHSDPFTLEQYIFLVFWLESLCSAPVAQRTYYYQLLFGNEGALPGFWLNIAALANDTGLPELTRGEKDEMLGHIAGISLPCAVILTSAREEPVAEAG